jgi:acetylornithine/succinyldiaminopimelate/putrescine aminotransferase
LLVNAVRPDAVRVAPPLLVTDDELKRALAILHDVLSELSELSDPADHADHADHPNPKA